MTRLSTLIILLTFSLSSFAQLTVTLEDSTMCPGDTLWFKASGMTSYAWSDTNNLDTTFLVDSVNFSTTVPGIYDITVLGYTPFPLDTDTVSFSVEVFSNPSVGITSSAGASFCEGSSTELVATGGFISYMWTPSTGLNSDSTDTVIATPSVATTYHVSIVDTNGCLGMDSIALTVTPGPTVTITSSIDVDNGYLCLGNTASLTANAAGISSYEWTPTASLNDSTSMTVQATPQATTTYTVVVTDSNGCTGSETYEITVNTQNPTLTINIEDDTICAGTSTEINLQSNGQSFLWTPGATLDNPNTRDVVASPTTTTTYTVSVTRLGCSITGTATINVIPAPSLSASQSSGGATICLDETDEIVVECSTCESYIWVFPNSTLTTTSSVQVVSPNEPGAINISITGIDGSDCRSTEVVTVNVDSCFNGEPWVPFGIAEEAAASLKVLNRGEQVEFVSTATISELRLFNLLGAEVMLQKGNANNITLMTSDFASGVYVARLVVNGQEVIKKIYLK